MAVDSYGNVVDLRPGGPATEATVWIAPELQAAGTVPPASGIVARAEIGRRSIPFWRADSVEQRYLPGANVLRTVARFGDDSTAVVRRLGGRDAVAADRRWLARSRPLGAPAPAWARRMYERSLLVLRASTDRRTGAVAAGAREGWAYVWPRDAAAVGIAFASAGYSAEARRVALFLLDLDLAAAARFDGTGEPVPGREAQGDAAGWVAAAVRAAGLPNRNAPATWRDRADYHEKSPGDYLANAIASARPPSFRCSFCTPETHKEQGKELVAAFETSDGLVRVAGDPDSGLDSAAAWAVRPFALRALFPAARRTLLRLAAESGRFGVLPSENWDGGEDPWTAPTAWTAWSLAALGERDRALRLIGALRRAATPLGMLPERVDAQTGAPRSTTPLAWSHAFAILALRELWPGLA